MGVVEIGMFGLSMFRRGILVGGARRKSGAAARTVATLLEAGDRLPSQYYGCIKFREWQMAR
jgi:hypothetical protein